MERLQRPGAQQRGGGSVPGGRRCRYRHWQPLHHCRHSEHGSSPPGPDDLQSDHRHPDQQLVPSIQRPSATPPTGAPTAHWSARREGPCRGPDCLLMSRATNWRRTPGWASRLASGLHGDVRRRPVRCSREAAREGGSSGAFSGHAGSVSAPPCPLTRFEEVQRLLLGFHHILHRLAYSCTKSTKTPGTRAPFSAGARFEGGHPLSP